MAIAGVEVGAERIEVQREMAQRNAELPTEGRIEFRIGINMGDVVVENEDIFGDGVNVAARLEALAEPGGICVSARVLALQGEEPVDDVARGKRHAGADVARAGALAQPFPCEVAGAVLESRGEDLVGGTQLERPRSDVHAGRRVLDERQVPRRRADIGREGGPRLGQELRQPARDEVDRLALQLALPRLIPLEDRPRARAEGAVVEEDDVRIEEEFVSHEPQSLANGSVRRPP